MYLLADELRRRGIARKFDNDRKQANAPFVKGPGHYQHLHQGTGEGGRKPERVIDHAAFASIGGIRIALDLTQGWGGGCRQAKLRKACSRLCRRQFLQLNIHFAAKIDTFAPLWTQHFKILALF